MAAIDDIISIPILDVVEKVWLQYGRAWTNEYKIIQDWKQTDWWGFNTEKNFVSDLSHDRPQWNAFAFVKSYYKIDDKSTYEWFENNFWVQKGTVSVDDYWFSHQNINESQKEYLLKRQINADKLVWVIRNIWGNIWCCLYDWVKRIGIKQRRITDDKSNRYISVAWYSWDGVYMHNIDPSKQYLIVVEGMTDFLTLRQYETNVVWLSSAQAGIATVKELAKNYEIYLCSDNDTAWKWVLNLLNSIEYYHFDVGSVDKKYNDINDLFCDLWWDEETAPEYIQYILDNAESRSPMSIIIDKWEERRKKLTKQGRLWFDSAFPQIDEQVSGIQPGELYTVVAFSNVGKTTFAAYLMQDWIKKKKKCFYFMMDWSDSQLLDKLVMAYDNVWFYDIYNKEDKYKIDKKTFNKYSMIYEDIYKLEDIENIIMDWQPEIVFIDYVQLITVEWKSKLYDKMEEISRRLKALGKQSWASIFWLSQVANDVNKDIQNWSGQVVTGKWWGDMYAASQAQFTLMRSSENNTIILKIDKNKSWPVWGMYYMEVDFKRNQMKIIENDW